MSTENMFIYFFGGIVILAIVLAIYYSIIKAAVKSAMNEKLKDINSNQEQALVNQEHQIELLKKIAGIE